MNVLELVGPRPDVERAATLLHEHELVSPTQAFTRGPRVRIDATEWLAPTSQLLMFDHRLHQCEDAATEALCMSVHGDGPSLAQAAVGVATRYRRLWPRRNDAADDHVFEAVLALHRRLHDCTKPLVRADFEHALDVWQWILCLAPKASRALQVAGLFHDVERLQSEALVRREQHASDYAAYKRAHAARGASMVLGMLEDLLPRCEAERVGVLVARHERPGEDRELAILNEADALSFFSLNSAGFLAYYGGEHTAKKVRYTVARMRSRRAFAELASLRLEPSIAEMLKAALSERPPSSDVQPDA